MPLVHDTGSTLPPGGAGVSGMGTMLEWSNPPGVATRLTANGPALQRDSFGFSFWLRPVNINPGDNLLAKEMVFNNSLPNYSRLAWQLSVLGDNGSGYAAVELIVRGSQRAQGDFFGNAVSAAVIPLLTDSRDWIHLAGGYDAVTGNLRLYVNGIETVSGNSHPGAHNRDGSPLTVGSVRNGTDFVTYAGVSFLDDLQLYADPLTAAEVAWLRSEPGRSLEPDFRIAAFTRHAGSDTVQMDFEATTGAKYVVEVATNLHTPFIAVASNTCDMALIRDAGTAPPLIGAGLEGDAIVLNWLPDGSSATRLSSPGPVLQTDSFGFSFWIRPNNLNPFDNLIAKETAFDNSIPLYSRVAWSVHVLTDDGFGNAPLQLIVRGDNRSQGDFFGTAISTTTIPLWTRVPHWIHVAGGYDTESGALRLYVNAVETVSQNSLPGARHSGGWPFSIGSARNGADFVVFAAATDMDDVQLYDGPVNASQASWLRANPGGSISRFPRLLAHWTLNETNAPYSNAAGLAGVPVAITVNGATVDHALGQAPRDRLFIRVKEHPPASAFEMAP